MQYENFYNDRVRFLQCENLKTIHFRGFVKVVYISSIYTFLIGNKVQKSTALPLGLPPYRLLNAIFRLVYIKNHEEKRYMYLRCFSCGGGKLGVLWWKTWGPISLESPLLTEVSALYNLYIIKTLIYI